MVKKSTKKVAKKTTKKATKKAAKKAAKKSTKKAAKKSTKKATKKVAKKATKKASAKASSKKATAKKNTAKKAAPQAAAPALPLPPVGSPAPSFTLPDQDGNMVSLESLRGKNVVVYFYPKAMTPGCTVQACGLRDVRQQLAEKDIVVLGVSPDKPAALRKFIERDQLNFTLLSDEDKSVAKAYGSFGQKSFMGRTFDGILRRSYLIGRDGTLKHIMTTVDTKTHAQDVMDFFSR